MRISKFGHSCLHVVDGDGSVLVDPGTFSRGYESLTGLTAVLVTHVHADHLDVAGLGAVLAKNPDAAVYVDSGSVEAVGDAAPGRAPTVVQPGDRLDVGMPVEVSGGRHAVIHADLPRAVNVCYRLGGRLFHPGDSLDVPDAPVEVLALPVAAPWMAAKEAVDYLRAVAPRTAIPIHEKVLAAPANTYRLISSLAPEGTSWVDIDDGRTVEV